MRLKHLLLFACIGFMVFASACSDKKKESDTAEKKAPVATVEDLYSHVPANSPYVMGNVNPVPQAYLTKVFAMYQKMIPTYGAFLKKLSEEEAGQPSESKKNAFEFFQGILDEMATLKTPEDMLANWGIDPGKSTSVFYGLGLLPAIRIAIADKQKTEAFVTRLEEKAGHKMEAAELNGQPYRFFEINEEKLHLKAILSITDTQLIAGLVLANQDAFDTFLPLLLGQTKPDTPLGKSGLTANLSKYNYPGYGDGYIDIKRIAAILRGEGEGLNLASFSALVPEPNFKVQIGCNPEFNRALFEHIPKMVFGYRTLSEDRAEVEFVLEASPSIIETLKKLPNPIPDIASERDPMFSMGMGVNLPELRTAIQRLLQFIIDNNEACPDINTAKLKEIMPKLNMVLNPMISGFHSFVLSLDSLEMGEDGKPVMDTISACAAAEMNDPQGLVAMGGAFLPSLTNLEINTDGTPVAVSLEGLPVDLPGLFVAIKGKRFALATGQEAKQQVKKAIASKEITDKPLLWFKYQINAWAQTLNTVVANGKQMEADDQEMVLAVFKEYAGMFKNLAAGVYITENGLVLREWVTMN